MKAIKITARNQRALAERYQLEEYEEALPIGWYVVAPFGTVDHDEYYEGVISQEQLNVSYVVIGNLENGWVALEEIS